MKTLPDIYWIPKLHKNPAKFSQSDFLHSKNHAQRDKLNFDMRVETEDADHPEVSVRWCKKIITIEHSLIEHVFEIINIVHFAGSHGGKSRTESSRSK